MSTQSKLFKKYLNKIHKTASKGDVTELEMLSSDIQRYLRGNEMYDLLYYVAAIYNEWGYTEKSIHLGNSYIMNLLKQDKTESRERTLYLFRKVDKYILEDLRNRKITASNHKCFNDPFDPLVSKLLQLKSETWGIKSHLIPSIDNVHITSFAEKGKSGKEPWMNTLMWAHYAKSHQGICIQIRVPYIFPSTTNEFLRYGRIDNVIYTNRKVSLEKRSATYQECFLQKQKEWQYENEVRLVYFDRTQSKDYLQISIDDCIVEAVYFGICCNKSNRTRVVKALKGQNVRFYQMQPNGHDLYTLKVEKTN